jgi:hypothetical protein
MLIHLRQYLLKNMDQLGEAGLLDREVAAAFERHMVLRVVGHLPARAAVRRSMTS